MAASESTAGQLVSDEEFQVLDLGTGLSESKSEPNPAGHSIQTQPDPASKTLKSQDSPACALPRCECKDCTMLKQFLKQYEVQVNSVPVSETAEPETPNSGKNSGFLPVWLVSSCKKVGKSCQTVKTRLSDVSDRVTASRPASLSLRMIVKVLVGIIILMVAGFTCLGVCSLYNHHGSSSLETRSPRVRKLERMVESYEGEIAYLRQELQKRDSSLKTLETQLARDPQHTENAFESKLVAQDNHSFNEKILRLAGMNYQELNQELGLTILPCVLPALKFRYAGESHTGSYRGKCFGQTPHGYGEVTTAQGLRIVGIFRGGKLHGTAEVHFKEGFSRIDYVHGVEHGIFHMLKPQSKLYCMQDGKAIGPQLHIDLAGTVEYSVSGAHPIHDEVPTVAVPSDHRFVRVQTTTSSGVSKSRLFDPSAELDPFDGLYPCIG